MSAAVTSMSGARSPAFGVMTWMPQPNVGCPARAAPQTAARSQLAAEVQPADERKEVAERRAVRRPQPLGQRETARGDSTCLARVPPQLAGDSRKMRLVGVTSRQRSPHGTTARRERCGSSAIAGEPRSIDRRHEDPVRGRRPVPPGVCSSSAKFLALDFQNTSATSPTNGTSPIAHVDPDVEQHPKLNDARHPQAVSLDDDRAANSAVTRSPAHGISADDGVPSETDPRARHPKSVVEQALQRPQSASAGAGRPSRSRSQRKTRLPQWPLS